MNQGKNFRYITFNTRAGKAYACVSFDWSRAENEIQYRAGISFCSPSDVFRKDLARDSAERRRVGSNRLKSKDKLIQSRIHVAEPATTFVTNKEFAAVFDDIITKCAEKNVVPNWAREAYRRGAFSFGLRNENAIQNKMPTV